MTVFWSQLSVLLCNDAKEKYATCKEPAQRYHSQRKMEELTLFLAPIKTSIQITWFSKVGKKRSDGSIYNLMSLVAADLSCHLFPRRNAW